MNNREAMQKAFEGQKFKVFSPFKCDITKNEGGNYVHDETIFAFAWFCRGLASQSQQGKERDLEMVEQIKARLKEIKSHSQDVSHITFNPLPPATTSQTQQDHIGDSNELAKHQPCGCVICTCEHETQCQGCGAKHCGTHAVGNIPNPVYLQSQAQQPYDHDLGSVLMALENAISELKGIIHNDNLKPYIAAKDKLIAYISTPESKEYWCGTCEQNVDKGCGDSACQWRYKLPPAPMNEVNKPEGDKK